MTNELRLCALERLRALQDECLIDADDVAALMALSATTVRQRRNPVIPRPVQGLRVLRWRLGAVRKALQALT